MDVQDVNKLALNVSNNVRKNLLQNRADQNKLDDQSMNTKDKKIQETKTTDVKKAKNNIEMPMMAQSTTSLSDPKEEAMKRFLIFNDPSKSSV
jgi:hypothetical protein